MSARDISLLMRVCEERGLILPRRFIDALNDDAASAISDLVYWPDVESSLANSLASALEQLDFAYLAAPPDHIPLCAVDEKSIACVVFPFAGDHVEAADDAPVSAPVVRWILSVVEPSHQGALIDTDPLLYVRSIAAELAARASALERMEAAAARFERDFSSRQARPRPNDERPVQIACQNVVVGMATLRHDARFDALRVGNFVTCEASHLATQEGARAMAALVLCDAFQAGGTMELRFGTSKNEEPIPPALVRLARTRGIELDETAVFIDPAQARELFLAVTPMPDDLRMRTVAMLDAGLLSPERLCFALMSNIWSPIELDYLVGTTPRLASILEGGAPAQERVSRLSELESCRAAIMAGMLWKRLELSDKAAGDGGVRVYEDRSAGTQWSIIEDAGAVHFAYKEGRAPWSLGAAPIELGASGEFVVAPRGLPTPHDVETLEKLRGLFPEAAVALVVPADMVALLPAETPALACPDRLAALDAQIERKLVRAQMGRSL